MTRVDPETRFPDIAAAVLGGLIVLIFLSVIWLFFVAADAALGVAHMATAAMVVKSTTVFLALVAAALLFFFGCQIYVAARPWLRRSCR